MIFSLLGLALIAIFLVGGYLFFKACRRGEEPRWLEVETLENTNYKKYATHIAAADRWLKSHNAQDVFVESRDGLRLHGHWIPAEKPIGTMLLAHGYRSTKLLDFGMVFELYHNVGMNLLIPDQRSHGQSEGKWITFGVKESRDMLCWLEFHNEKYGYLPVVLSGLSMGASTMLYLADADLPDNVKGIIADCGFTSPSAIVGKVFKDVVHIPAGVFLWAADLLARIFAGFSFYEKDSRKSLKHNRLPVFLVHGMADDFVPCEMTRQAFKACTGKKQLLLVDGAGHGESYLVDGQNYKEMVIAFLNENIRR